MANDVQFFRLSVMLSDLSIHQSLFHSVSLESERGSTTQLQQKVPWTRYSRPQMKFISAEFVHEDEDFVAEDGLETGSAPILAIPNRHEKTPATGYLELESDAAQGDDAAVNYGPIYGTLSRKDDSVEGAEETGLQPEEVTSIIERVRNLLDLDQESTEERGPRGTM